QRITTKLKHNNCNHRGSLLILWIKHNARLKGWQRITTKLKHTNRNHRGSMGLETPRVDSPS
ncbi:hypothetical protein, partial [Vibrio cholerae]|uniref:hypothetical protein n=1 Tax=Vibrio cholerae TaxID=666 RepID=UPI001A9D24F9